MPLAAVEPGQDHAACSISMNFAGDDRGGGYNAGIMKAELTLGLVDAS